MQGRYSDKASVCPVSQVCGLAKLTTRSMHARQHVARRTGGGAERGNWDDSVATFGKMRATVTVQTATYTNCHAGEHTVDAKYLNKDGCVAIGAGVWETVLEGVQ